MQCLAIHRASNVYSQTFYIMTQGVTAYGVSMPSVTFKRVSEKST